MQPKPETGNPTQEAFDRLSSAVCATECTGLAASAVEGEEQAEALEALGGLTPPTAPEKKQ